MRPKRTRMKNQAWGLMSKVIRLEARDKHGMVTCVTCGKRAKPIGEGMQAGHFCGRNNSVIFDERNVHVQCTRCNYYLSSNPVKYLEFMVREYGEDVVDELERRKKRSHYLTVDELSGLIEDFKTRLKVQEAKP